MQFVEILYHPLLGMLVVRPGKKNNKHTVRWSVLSKEKYRPCKIKGTAFMPVLYELMEWQEELRYTLTGFVKEKDGEKVLAFYTEDAEIRVYENGKMKTAYKNEWTESFGDRYLKQLAKSRAMFDPDREWGLMGEGVVADVREFKMGLRVDYRDEMEQLKWELEKEMDDGNITEE